MASKNSSKNNFYDYYLRNSILSCIGENDFSGIIAAAHLVNVPAKSILLRHGDVAENVFFLLSGLTSISLPIKGDATIDITTIGREGVIGAEVVIGQEVAVYTAIQRVGGQALKIRTSDLCFLVRGSSDLSQLLLKFVGHSYQVASQAAACNVRHSVRQRLARCLLSASEQLGDCSVNLTHEALSAMLNVRRVGVTLAVSALNEEGAVRQKWGQIRIANRLLLEKAACRCRRVGVLHYECTQNDRF